MIYNPLEIPQTIDPVGLLKKFIKVQLIYNAVLISAVQQRDSVVYKCSFSCSITLWFITG